MKVKINGEEFEFVLDSVWGAMYLYEDMTDRPFDVRKSRCLHLMFYAILLMSNPGTTLSLSDFIMALNDMELTKQLTEYYTKRMEVLATGKVEVEQPDEDGKKKD